MRRGRFGQGVNDSGRRPGRQPARVCYVNCYVVCRLKSVSISVTARLAHQDRGKTATFDFVSSQINVARDSKTSAFLRLLSLPCPDHHPYRIPDRRGQRVPGRDDFLQTGVQCIGFCSASFSGIP